MTQDLTAPRTRIVIPKMVYLGSDDPDRAAGFLAEVLGWRTERVEYRGHVRHYVLGDFAVRPCITDEPGASAVQLGFEVQDVAATAQLVEGLGGSVTQDDLDDEEGPFVAVRDNQNIALSFWAGPSPREFDQQGWAPPGGIAYFAICVPDLERATTFYGRLLGWPFENLGDPAYRHVADHVAPVAMGIVGGAAEPRIALYFIVTDLKAAASAVSALGGSAGEPYPTGPMLAVDCHDDRGLSFSIAVPKR
jgi:predicted enzyme related to lactoylglutathione lyase